MPEIKLSKPLKYSHPKGTKVTVIDKYINRKTNEEIWFIAPKVDGVYFNKAKKFFANAMKLRVKAFDSIGPVNPKDMKYGNAFTNKRIVFGFFTEACSGIILLFAAVESLTNTLIERASKHEYTTKAKVTKFSIGNCDVRCNATKILSLDELLSLTIEEKLKKVLPFLYNFESPSGKYFWQDFIKLKTLRNGLIHSTKEKAYGAHKGVNSIFAELFDLDFGHLINSISDLLKYLGNNAK